MKVSVSHNILFMRVWQIVKCMTEGAFMNCLRGKKKKIESLVFYSKKGFVDTHESEEETETLRGFQSCHLDLYLGIQFVPSVYCSTP